MPTGVTSMLVFPSLFFIIVCYSFFALEMALNVVIASEARQSRGESIDFYTGLLRFARNDVLTGLLRFARNDGIFA
jgi:hypothetical protein